MAKALTKLNKLVSGSLSIAGKCQQQGRLLCSLNCHDYHQVAELINKNGRSISKRFAVSSVGELKTSAIPDVFPGGEELHVTLKLSFGSRSTKYADQITRDVLGADGTTVLSRGRCTREHIVGFRSPFQVLQNCGANSRNTCFSRSISSRASQEREKVSSETKKDISTVEDPFDAPTYNIPEKPVTFTEGASYSVIILAGLGVAAAAGYAVFKELIFQPKEYKIFDKALKRIQDDSQVRIRIGSPITGYGQESRNRAARQRIPNRVWTDEDGVERVEVNFYVRGPHGAGKVYTEMFKDEVDKQWKFTYLIVEIKSPSPAQLILESYMPA